MKISTRLKLAALVPAFMALLISLALFLSYRVVEKAQEKDRTAQRIMRSVNDLNGLADAYMLHHEERPKLQFLQVYQEMSLLIAAARFDDREQKLLENIRQNSEAMRASFLRLVLNFERHGSAQNVALLREAEERLAGQLDIRSHRVASAASRLERIIDDEITETQKRISALTFILIMALVIPLTIILLRMTKGIAASLATLRKGTEIIGAGTLDHRIGMAARDEIGDLSRSFDRMTARLQAVTVSKDELQQEVEIRKQAEEYVFALNKDIAARNEELENANRELDAFSYSVSHDLRAPLRSIKGFSRALMEDYADRLDTEGRNNLDRILAATQRMGHLIDALLNLSQISRTGMNRTTVDLSGMAVRIAEGLQQARHERGVEFIIAEGLSAYGDERLLNIVLENLIGNAWKFTENRPAAVIEFGIADCADGPAYFVKDNGAGFDMAYADKLFVPFQRLHTSSEFPGAGIGLATVKRIINRHGGNVMIEGERGKGTTVYFTLPSNEVR